MCCTICPLHAILELAAILCYDPYYNKFLKFGYLFNYFGMEMKDDGYESS